MAKRSKRPPEAPSGPFFALPHSVLDSEAWKRCSPHARALLMELCRQHNGRNNGHLHLSRTWLAPRGWKRPITVNKLRDELIENQLILKTRHGGLNNGTHWFALTWLPITDFADFNLDVKGPRDYHPGAYHLPPIPQQHKKEKKGCTPHVRAKAAARTPHVHEEESPRTPHVREKALLSDSPRTPHVHNVYNQYYPQQSTVSGGEVVAGDGTRIVEVFV
mgnify:CR=1 FL=1